MSIRTPMSAVLPFNEKKATQAAAYFLKRRGGRMSYMKLIKLLYLADRKALLTWGRPITTDRYFSMNHGPVLSRVLELTTDGEARGTKSIWTSVISEPAKYDVCLKGVAGDDELSDAEIGVEDEIFGQFGAMSRWDLVETTHCLPEWKDPYGGAIPISYGDILRAAGKTHLEIAAIEDEICHIAEIDALFSY
jgi:uncharacterized phage-associated protein